MRSLGLFILLAAVFLAVVVEGRGGGRGGGGRGGGGRSGGRSVQFVIILKIGATIISSDHCCYLPLSFPCTVKVQTNSGGGCCRKYFCVSKLGPHHVWFFFFLISNHDQQRRRKGGRRQVFLWREEWQQILRWQILLLCIFCICLFDQTNTK